MQGIIDIDKEVSKLHKKQADQEKRITSLMQKLANPDYQHKVPKDVQAADAEKVSLSLDLSQYFVTPKCT